LRLGVKENVNEVSFTQRREAAEVRKVDLKTLLTNLITSKE